MPRFEARTVGGAERLVRALATRALPDGWAADVATTCATDHVTWRNDLEPGTSVEEGVRVRRFPVGERDARRYDRLHASVIDRAAGYLEELEWLSSSVWSPDLERFLQRHAVDYDLLVFTPYLFGTTLWGAQVAPERSALMPCLHDEPYAYLRTVRHVVESVRGCLFNSLGEERLARRLYRVREGGIVGMGYAARTAPPSVSFAASRGLGPYVLYAGRLEEGKSVHVAVDYAVRYATERRQAPKLVLIGSGAYRPPKSASDAVVYAGFVSEEEKRAAYAEAIALVNPSRLESLSIVLMEAWLEGTPVLVNLESDVLREHCQESGAGLTFDSYESYRDALDRLVSDPTERNRMGQAGERYVLEAYGWPAVRRRFRELVERLAA